MDNAVVLANSPASGQVVGFATRLQAMPMKSKLSALIGIAALVLQFANRSGNRSPAVAEASPVAAASAAPIQRAAAPASAVLLPAAVVAPAVAAPVAIPAAPTRTAAASAPLVASTDPVQRQARCIDILQKASLEKITVAETEFFKKECK